MFTLGIASLFKGIENLKLEYVQFDPLLFSVVTWSTSL